MSWWNHAFSEISMISECHYLLIFYEMIKMHVKLLKSLTKWKQEICSKKLPSWNATKIVSMSKMELYLKSIALFLQIYWYKNVEIPKIIYWATERTVWCIAWARDLDCGLFVSTLILVHVKVLLTIKISHALKILSHDPLFVKKNIMQVWGCD